MKKPIKNKKAIQITIELGSYSNPETEDFKSESGKYRGIIPESSIKRDGDGGEKAIRKIARTVLAWAVDCEKDKEAT